MAQFDLSLQSPSPPPPPPPAGAQPARRSPPVLGGLAVAFGVLGILTWAIPFVPLGLILSILAILFGQWGWGILGLFLGFFGIITSPVLMALIGLGAFVWLVDWPTFIPHVTPPSGGPTVPT